MVCIWDDTEVADSFPCKGMLISIFAVEHMLGK